METVNRVIEYKGKTYKLVFNLNVMEAIQNEYGTLDKWGELTDGGKNGETDIKALVFGFTEMVNEGIEIDNEDNGTNTPLLTHKQVARLLTDYGIDKATDNMNSLVVDSTKADSDDSKNA